MPVESARRPESSTRMNHSDPVYNGVDTPSEIISNCSATLHAAASRKEKTNSIFSFLQRFRVKNKTIFDENVTSLPSSPHTVRRLQKPRNRWESAESVLSTATANSFAFIPPSQLRGGPRLLHPSAVPEQVASEIPSTSLVTASAGDNTGFLRRKYNLLGSEVSLCPSDRKRSLKNCYRNSIGNVENIRTEYEWCRNENVFSSFRQSTKPAGLAQRPRSEYSVSGELSQSRRIHCHRPGKGRAPPPPTIGVVSAKARSKSTPRKKRKAPSPPTRTMSTNGRTEVVNSDVIVEEVEKTEAEKSVDEATVCNDSLKLEKGQLKPNNTALTIHSSNSSISSDLTLPVSPKPWYKRSSIRKSKKTRSKKKTPEQMLDEWILEAGLPRSTSFCSDRKIVEPVSGKRKSQISMLANISELDREAAEIVKKERKKEHEMASSANNRFYDPSPFCGQSTSWNKYASTKEDTSTSGRRHTSKDLISILNAITNVTKITVNANIFKDGSISHRSDLKRLSSEKPTEQKDASNKLTITEVHDSSEKKRTSESPVPKQREEIPKSAESPSIIPSEVCAVVETKEASKPTKPFSSWICPQCTLENPSWKFICEACNKWRPYSVNKINGRPTPLITPKEDVKIPQAEKLDRDSLLKERDEIKKISESIRKQVYDILTSGENVRNNLSKLKFSEEQKAKIKDAAETDLEETRRARLAFFSKNSLNDLNRERETSAKVIAPQSGCTKNKYYNEEDKKKLREILKELKDSLPAPGTPSERTSLIRQNSNNATSATSKIENDKFNKLKEKLELSAKSADESKSPASLVFTQIIPASEPLYSVPLKKSLRNSKSKAERREPKICKTQSTKFSSHGDGSFEKDTRADEKKEINSEKISDTKQSSDYKGASKENKSAAHLMVNRLLKKLQTAIASGQHHEAANIARELARLKVNCNMTRQETPDLAVESSLKGGYVSVHLHLRRNAIQLVPILLKLNSNLTINDLKDKISADYDISSEKQVWMVRGKLIEDESTSLEQLGASESEIFDLYLYSSSDNGNSSANPKNGDISNKKDSTRTPSQRTGTNDAKRNNVNETRNTHVALAPLTENAAKGHDHSDSLASPHLREHDTKFKNTPSSSKIKTRAPPILDNVILSTLHAGAENGRIVATCSGDELKNARTVSEEEKNTKRGTTSDLAAVESKNRTECKKTNIAIEIDVKNALEIPTRESDKSESDAAAAISTGESRVDASEDISMPSKSCEPKEQLVKKSEEDESESLSTEIKAETGANISKLDFHISNGLGSDPDSGSSNGWKCRRCTLINPVEEKVCEVCGHRMSDSGTSLETQSESESGQAQRIEDRRIAEFDRLANYKELVDMEKSDIILNVEKFECSVCFVEYEPGDGVILKDCLHTFCKGCLAQTVQHSSEAEVKCPYRDDNYACESVLQEREIKALVTPDVYEQHLTRSVKEAENKIQNTFHCKTPNCRGWCIFEDNVNEFLCPVCDKSNCLTCQVIHTGLNCKQYQEIINQESETNADANRTRLMLLEMLEKKDAMTCPTCQVILMKKWGCDWLRCSMCKTEICWVTRGPRWGPKGKGDTSGGCRCGVRGIKCHPRCSYCH